MSNINRANIILALAEVVQDTDVIEAIQSQSGEFESLDELAALEEKVMNKIKAYRMHDLWPPNIESITKVMNFDS
jgi:hypothetical protein